MTDTQRVERTKVQYTVWARGPYSHTLFGIFDSEASARAEAASEDARRYGAVEVDRVTTTTTPIVDHPYPFRSAMGSRAGLVTR